MNWDQSITSLEILTGILFLILYLGYIFRIHRLARHFKQKPNVVWIKFGFRTVYFVLIIIALLGPSFGAMKKQIKTIGKDIFILVDITASMNARDVPPSRLEKVKYELRQLIQKFNSDRIGLIVFSSDAYVQCPLTYDQSALLLFAETLNTNLLPRAGANYEVALQLALTKFKANNQPNIPEKRAEIIVLISDGEDFSPNLNPIYRDLNRENIRVISLGVGSENGVPIPLTKGFVTDDKGKRVISKLNAERLAEIAGNTNGQYFEIGAHSSEIPRLISAINAIEGERQETRTVDVRANKYYYPLFIAFIFIMLDILIIFNVIRL
ncbi:vWA domain-containing protein [Adhaeribacter radiodurans]|uniref:VWA domain-containing protein n=1 Tax=Adhaeribacter radiodurans TaxID=2745197 RepID=A0A7L7L5Q6_9BACT|nr:VWA domain-containing protein [Adhaeribacter radiodurans]QMU28110.1 VWA domain-containing protein [Adhaeribacter radiodurans]